MSQADLDQNLGPDMSAPPVAPLETLAQALSEEDRCKAFFAQGIPAGVQVLAGEESAQLDIFMDDELSCPSDVSESEVLTDSLESGHFEDDEEEVPEHFLLTKPTRPSDDSFPEKIAQRTEQIIIDLL